MKRIYLVRHGESEGNVQRIVGGKNFLLTDHGRSQASQLATRVANLGIEKVISSDFVRAVETGEIIAAQTNVDLEQFDMFGEKLSPTSFYGLSDTDPKELEYVTEGNKRICDPEYRFEDGENFFDVHKRVNDAKALLENEECESILVVTHGFFLSYFIAAILIDAKEPAPEVLALALKIKLGNAGISRFDIDGTKWKLATLNDMAHFAE